MNEVLRVVLVDDHEIFLEGLSSLIDREEGMEVVGTARNGRAAICLAGSLVPDVLVMDVSMAGLNGIEATRQIVGEQPAVRVLCLSMHSGRRYVSAAVEAGAAGYVLKDCALEELAFAVRQVALGHSYLSPAVAATVLDDYAAHLSGQARPARVALSEREREVLQLLAEGHTTRDIAGQLHLSPKTIGSHRERIMKKLDIHSVAGLTKYAVRHGYTSED